MANKQQTKKQQYSGIGGQAVLEGVMMRNKNLVAVAVRKPDQEIEVEVEERHGILEGTIWVKLPFVRGIFMFIDSMVTGIQSLNYAASFYEDEEEDTREISPEKKARNEKIMMGITTAVSLVLAIGLFVVLPVILTGLLRTGIRNDAFLALMEGLIRLFIFLIYISGISMMKDIRRLYQYHGAEHKCINCIERGKPLTVHYVRDSSRFHKRCGTSFIILVLLISIILFFFVRVNNPFMRVLVRIAMIPVVSGIAYELIRLAGRTDNLLVRLVSAPGMWLQHITTKEPEDDMIEVAIASVEAVFDWRAYLHDKFGYDERDLEEY